MGPRHAVLKLAAALLLVAIATTAPVVDARVVSVFHPGRSLAVSGKVAAAIEAAKAKAKEAQELSDKLEGTSSGLVKKCLEVCEENFESAVDSLQKASGFVKDPSKHYDLMNELSASVTFVNTCNEAFVERPGVKSPIADTYEELKKLVVASLDMGADLKN